MVVLWGRGSGVDPGLMGVGVQLGGGARWWRPPVVFTMWSMKHRLEIVSNKLGNTGRLGERSIKMMGTEGESE